jgi:hypothetical protein
MTTTQAIALKVCVNSKGERNVKFYIASRYSRRNEMRLVAQRLIAKGLIVTSRWLSEDKPLQTQMGDDSDEFYIETAKIDLEDIDAASHVLFFSEDPLIGTPRGGRHVEYGYALAKRKQIRVIGPKENVFHYGSDLLKHYETLDAYIGVDDAAN